jgi:hypothetical protein
MCWSPPTRSPIRAHAIEKGIAKVWFGAAWLGVIALSSIFVIKLCNRILPDAVAADRAAGRDQTSRRRRTG